MSRVRQILLAVISVFFLFAGISKILDAGAFSIAIEQYQLVGGALSWGIALWLPWVECLSAVGIWRKEWRVSSAIVLSGMLVVFQVALLSAMVRGLDISCGCFGSGTETGTLFSFARNFVLLAGVLILTCGKTARK